MKKLVLSAVVVLAMLCATGCWPRSGGLGNLDSVPKNAELLYSTKTGYENGIGVTYESFENAEEVGFFVVEILRTDGGLKGLELKAAGGGNVASFGNVDRDAVFITDLQTEAAGGYNLFCLGVESFGGEINVYFVPGLGYE